MIRSDNYFQCFCERQVDCTSDEGIRAHISACPKYLESSNIMRIFKNMNMEAMSTEDLKVIGVELTAWCDDLRGKIKNRTGEPPIAFLALNQLFRRKKEYNK